MGIEFDKACKKATDVFWSYPDSPWVDPEGTVSFGHTYMAATKVIENMPVAEKCMILAEIIEEDLDVESESETVSTLEQDMRLPEALDYILYVVIGDTIELDLHVNLKAREREDLNNKYWEDK